MKTMIEIFDDHSGKTTLKWSSYIKLYEKLFSPFKDKNVNVLEIGVQNGGSIEIWSKYFKNFANIVGCDSDPKCVELEFANQNIHIINGDACSESVQEKIIRLCERYDIIIDDGSHISHQIIDSFIRYFDALDNGGIYIVEDIHCSYWKEYNGGLYYPKSAMSFFKRLADVINFEHIGTGKTRQDLLLGFNTHSGEHIKEETLSMISSVSFHNSVCVITKGEPKLNTLGELMICGTTSSICNKHTNFDSKSLPPSQESNFWSTLKTSPDEEWETLKEQNLLNEKKISELTNFIDEQNNKIQSLEYSLDAVVNSISWKITKPIREMLYLYRRKNLK